MLVGNGCISVLFLFDQLSFDLFILREKKKKEGFGFDRFLAYPIFCFCLDIVKGFYCAITLHFWL